MTPDPKAAREVNDAAYALVRLARRAGSPDALIEHALNAARISDAVVDALSKEAGERFRAAHLKKKEQVA